MITVKKRDWFPTIIMLLFFICSSESLIVGTNSSQLAWIIYTTVHYVVFALLAIRMMTQKSLHINLLFLVASMIILMVVNFMASSGSNKISTYIHICMVIINAWLIVEQFSFDKFANVFENAIFLMAVYSLIIYVIALLAPQIIRSLPVITNIAGNRYYSAGLAIISENGLNSGSLFRSFGVFREPGMFQLFLKVAFCIYLFRQKGNSVFKIAVYILTILSTVSTTGIIAMLLIFVIFTIASDTKRKGLIVFILSASIILLYWLSLSYDIFSNAISKVENENDASTIARLYSFIANIKIWLSYPLIGSGMSVNGVMFPKIILSATKNEVADNTNTYMYILSCFGILPFSIFVTGLYRVAKSIMSKCSILLFLVFLILLAGENLIYSSFAWIFVFYGFTSAKQTKKCELSGVGISDKSYS